MVDVRGVVVEGGSPIRWVKGDEHHFSSPPPQPHSLCVASRKAPFGLSRFKCTRAGPAVGQGPMTFAATGASGLPRLPCSGGLLGSTHAVLGGGT